MARRPENLARLGLASALLVGIVLPVVASVASGTIDAAQGDDWAFTRAAFSLRESHHFLLVGWGEMNLVGHLLWSVPFQWAFGSSVATLHAANAVAATVALLATYGLLRELVTPGRAALGTIVLAAFPAFALLSASFMTDVTAFAAAAVCVYLGVVALRMTGRRRDALLLASVAVGCAGFASREVAILAPVAVVLGHVYDARAHDRPAWRVAWLLGGIAVFGVVLLSWARGIPGRQDPELNQTLAGSALQGVRGFATLALFLTPALLLTPIRRSAAAGAAALAAGVYVLGRAADAPQRFDAIIGNYFTRFGALQNDVSMGVRPAIFGDAAWDAIGVCALLAGGALAAVLAQTAPQAWRGRRTLDPRMVIVGGYGAITLAAFVVRALQGGVMVDRYLLPLLVVLAVVVLRGEHAPRRAAPAAAASAALVVTTTLVVLNMNAFFGARLDAARAAVAAGVPADAVDGGFEWAGLHAADGTALPGPAWQDPKPWWAYLFPQSSNCVELSASPVTAGTLRLRGTVRYHRLPWRTDHIYVYWNTLACDPSTFQH